MLHRRRSVTSALIAGSVLVAGCSSGASPSTASPSTVSSVSTLVAVAPVTAPSNTAAVMPKVEEPDAPEMATVELSVRAEALRIDEVVTVAYDPTVVPDSDPFVEFASCAGLRSTVGVYAVSAAQATGNVRAVSLLSVDQANAPGLHDIEVRIEPAEGDAVSAVGTMTLDAGLRSGTFRAFDLGGNEVSGGFSCADGSSEPPVPLKVGSDDGRLDAVEVVALLRRGRAERVVSLAIESGAVGAATMSCPGAAGTTGPEVVRVDGDQRIGVISTFELTSGSPATMRLHLGGAVFDFADVDATVDPSGASGVFSAATSGGVTIDGAFRCT